LPVGHAFGTAAETPALECSQFLFQIGQRGFGDLGAGLECSRLGLRGLRPNVGRYEQALEVFRVAWKVLGNHEFP